MKLTNKHNVNPIWEKAIRDAQWQYKATHDKASDISVTQLINSPQIVHLQKVHGEDIEEDVTDNLYSLEGSIIHSILEKAGESVDNLTVEKRLYWDVEVQEMGVFKISGMFDAYDWDTKTLSDYKYCSVWEFINGVKVDRVRQLNVLAYLAHHNGYEVEKITAEAFFRDWSPSQAKKGGNYPALKVASFELPLWPYEEQKRYVEDRVELHMMTQNGHPYECTEEERWAKPDVWAVMKQGRKSAVKLHEIEEEAHNHVTKLGTANHYIQHRPGENTRCENYCNVREFCSQYKEMVNES